MIAAAGWRALDRAPVRCAAEAGVDANSCIRRCRRERVLRAIREAESDLGDPGRLGAARRRRVFSCCSTLLALPAFEHGRAARADRASSLRRLRHLAAAIVRMRTALTPRLLCVVGDRRCGRADGADLELHASVQRAGRALPQGADALLRLHPHRACARCASTPVTCC